METFGERMRRLRQQREMSLDDLARKTGISKAYLWKLERKPDANPSIEIARTIAKALGTTVATLVPTDETSEADSPEIPESLAEAKGRFKMSEQDVLDLAGISFRGQHPMTAEEWGLLYLQLKQMVDGGDG